MEIRQLEYVVGVVDEGGFTRAAEALHVTQPALSDGIRRLEAEVGLELFHRVGRRAVLSAAGEAFVEPARQVLRDLGVLRTSVAAVAGLTAGTLPRVAPPPPGPGPPASPAARLPRPSPPRVPGGGRARRRPGGRPGRGAPCARRPSGDRPPRAPRRRAPSGEPPPHRTGAARGVAARLAAGAPSAAHHRRPRVGAA